MSNKLINELQTGDYGTPLKQFHKDAMLELILAWGTLDGALTILVAAFMGEELHIAAKRLSKVKGTAKLLEIARILETNEQGVEFANKFKKQKKHYEKFSKPRNRIAHAHCVGYLLSDDKYLVFAVAEPEGIDQMAIEAISVESITAAAEYGRTLTAFASRTAEKIRIARSM